MSIHQITEPVMMLLLATAGNSYFTLLNRKTGNRVTYNVKKEESGGHTVRTFTGTDNSKRTHYTYLGFIENGVLSVNTQAGAMDQLLSAAEESGDAWLVNFINSISAWIYRGRELTPRQVKCLKTNLKKYKISSSIVADTDIRSKGFVWFWNKITQDNPTFPEGFEYWHEGRCARCAKRLTVPESIKNGLGPECVTYYTLGA